MSSDNRPPRWLNCPCYSELIADTFIAFKTPLSDRYKVPEICKFTPETFVSRMQSNHQRTLGLWISLTFTERYYDKDAIQSDTANNIKYIHIECRGHDGAPSEEETRRFITTCRTFLRQNPDKLIGVHCTHGFNRTGFMICAYLCECDQFAVDAAISVFGSKRRPGIYKQSYIDELIRRYGDPDDPEERIVAPERPAWCHEDLNGDMGIADPELIDDDGIYGPAAYAPDNGGAEGDGSNMAEFMDGIVSGVKLVTTRAIVERVFAKTASMCHWDLSAQRVRFPGCQPVSMTQNNVTLLAQNRYMVSWKADGSRFMMLIEDANRIYFLTRRYQVYQIDGLIFPMRDNLEQTITDTLVDGELVIDKNGNENIPRFLIYDIIAYRGNTSDFGDKHFEHRYSSIEEYIIRPREAAKQQGKIDRTREPFGIRKKKFFELAQTKDVLRMKLAHQIDGLIFQPCREGYTAGTCDRVLKWKPPELNSIDLRLNIRETRERGMLPERTGLLTTCNQRPGSYFKKIKYSHDLEQYDGKIVECAWDFQAQSWRILRERKDKLTANTVETANSVLHSIIYPVSKEFLVEYIYNKVLRNNPNNYPLVPSVRPSNHPNATTTQQQPTSNANASNANVSAGPNQRSNRPPNDS